jgi:putative ABC transport system permease protein
VSAGQERHAWQQVGADVRVDTGTRGLPPELARRLGAAAAARAYTGGTFLATGAGSRPGPRLLAVEPNAYRRVLAAGPEAGARAALSELGELGGGELATVAAGAWSYGGTVAVRLGGHALRLHVVAARGSFPSAPADSATAVVSLPALERALGAGAVAPNRLYANRARPQSVPGARVASREAELRRVRSAPLVEGATRGLRAAIALAAAFAALVVFLSVVLTAQSRSRDLAHLAALGLSPRQATALVAGELAPPALVSAAAGTALGIGVALLVEPGIDLSFFTGGPAPLTLPVGLLAALAAGLVVLVAAAALAVGARARRVDPSLVLRIGENRAS